METENTGPFLMAMRHVKVLSDHEIQDVLLWVDRVPLTREKANLVRDFSDAVPMAEILKHHLPKYVELHQYPPANSTKSKEQNWYHLNRNVLIRIGLELHEDVIHALAQCKPWVLENVLMAVRERIDNHIYPMATNRSIRLDDSPAPKKSEMIHRNLDKQQRKQIEEQEKTIDLLTGKIMKLEHIIRLKDIRIDDLTTRLEKVGINVPDTPLTSRYATLARRK